MEWGRRLVGGIGVVAGAGLVVIGISLAAVSEDVFGEPWHPHGSLGLAVVLGSLAMLVIAGWVALAPSSAWRRPWRFVDTPGRLGVTAALLVLAAIGVIAVTAQVGGAIMYHPYDWFGLEMLAVAALLLLRAGWWIAAAHPPRRR